MFVTTGMYMRKPIDIHVFFDIPNANEYKKWRSYHSNPPMSITLVDSKKLLKTLEKMDPSIEELNEDFHTMVTPKWR